MHNLTQTKEWKQIHKYNLYKSCHTFVQESEEGETTKKSNSCHESFYHTKKVYFWVHILKTTFKTELRTLH